MGETRERPILFSGPLVRGILEGRKTQTRRPVTVPWKGSTRAPPYEPYYVEEDGRLLVMDEYGDYHPFVERFRPYGEPGDRLWVRETWRPRVAHSHGMDACDCSDVLVTYAADGAERFFSDGTMPDEWVLPKAARRGGQVPSLHMPRWASRLNLEVLDIRVERLQAITEEDAKAEGAWRYALPEHQDPEVPFGYFGSAREEFGSLWDGAYGAGAWDANPWVWCVSFRRLP